MSEGQKCADKSPTFPGKNLQKRKKFDMVQQPLLAE